MKLILQSAAKIEEAAHTRDLSEAEAEVHSCSMQSNQNAIFLDSCSTADQQNEVRHHE
jgi:hypothetical protein